MKNQKPRRARSHWPALDGGHLNWPIVDAYLAMYNETIMETER